MNQLKSQKELIDDKDSRVIILSGGYGAGKGTVLAFKTLQYKTSLYTGIVLDDIVIDTYKQLLEQKFYYDKYSNNINIYSKNCLILMRDFEKANTSKYNTELIIFDNFELIEEDKAIELYNQALDSTAKQIILSISPIDLTKDNFIRELAKTEKVITMNLQDNCFLPSSCIDDLKCAFKDKEEYKNVITGEFLWKFKN